MLRQIDTAFLGWTRNTVSTASLGRALPVDDEPDVADLFRQHFRREVRRGSYVMHFATSGDRDKRGCGVTGAMA